MGMPELARLNRDSKVKKTSALFLRLLSNNFKKDNNNNDPSCGKQKSIEIGIFQCLHFDYSQSSIQHDNHICRQTDIQHTFAPILKQTDANRLLKN